MHVLVVGSSLIDFFLHFEKSNHIHIENRTVEMTLGDKIPVEVDTLTMGGNGANVSVGIRRLGISTSFYTYLGSDILSSQIEQNLEEEGVNLLTKHIRGQKTSLSLILNFQTDRIILSHHEVRDHTFHYAEQIIPDLIYLTSIGDTWEKAYEEIVEFSQKHSIPLAFSPGSHQMKDMNSTFINALKSATMLFINREEAEAIVAKVGKAESRIEPLLLQLKDRGLKIVSVTDGSKGAYSVDEQSHIYKILSFGDNKKLIEKTGAGDSYAAGFLASYLLGNPLDESMRWGGLNAFSVMQHVGAQPGLLTKKAMMEQSVKHHNYKAEKIR